MHHPLLTPRKQRGFTLVEIAGVAILIALLVGATLAGLSLRRVGELKIIMQEVTKYKDAVGIFQNRYNALPGDMINATDYWGALDPDPHICATTPSTDVRTCNGTGDGKIGAGTWSFVESFLAWQHLANARLIEGSYEGDHRYHGQELMAKGCRQQNHCPSSRYPNAFYYIATPAAVGYPVERYFKGMDVLGTDETRMYRGAKGHVLVFSRWAGSTSEPHNPILSPEDAASIDAKHDDGRPGTGHIQTFINQAVNSNRQQCSLYPSGDQFVFDPDPTTATYNIQFAGTTFPDGDPIRGPQCTLIFTNAF